MDDPKDPIECDRTLNSRPDAAPAETQDEEPRVLRAASPGGRRAFLRTITTGVAAGTVAVAAESCGGSDSPSAPTPNTTTSTSTTSTSTTTTALSTATLAGVVSDQAGKAIGGARVSVVDGPSSGKSALTDGNGYYSMAGVVRTSFTARATAAGYRTADKGLTLSGDTRLDFTLTFLGTTTSTTTTSVGGCTCVGACGCNGVCSCNPLSYYYPN